MEMVGSLWCSVYNSLFYFYLVNTVIAVLSLSEDLVDNDLGENNSTEKYINILNDILD